MHLWDLSWQLWLAFMLIADFTAAKLHKGYTFSEHVWYWFSVKDHDAGWQFRRAILYLFTIALVAHLWFAFTVVPLVVLAVPFGYVVLARSSNMGKVFGWLKGAAGSVWDFVKRRGPILTNVVGAVALLFPQYGTLINAALAILGQGSAPSSTDVVKALAALGTAGIAFYGAIVKTIAVIKASQQPK